MGSHVWTVSEAKARLSEVLRRAEAEGPQRIGARRTYVVVPEAEWRRLAKGRPPLGKWLLEHVPRGEALDLPSRADPPRAQPFEGFEQP